MTHASFLEQMSFDI